VPGVAAHHGLTLFRIELPLRRPFVSAHGTESVRDVVLARWTGPSGSVGWGECPTLSTFGYADEITDTAWRFLCDVVGPVVERTGALPAVEGAPMAMGAVRDAQLDSRLRAEGRSLIEHVTADGPDEVDTCRVIGLDDELPAGTRAAKVKITPDRVDGLRALRERHPELELAADANGSFAGVDDVPGWIADLGLSYLEQPFPPGDLVSARALRERLGVPVALDESVVDLRSLHRAIAAEALDLVSIKPARVGGIEQALELAEVAGEAGVGGFVGGMLETGVGRAGAAALAAHPSLRSRPTDLGPSDRYFAQDVTEPVRSRIDPDGRERLLVPVGDGIGRAPIASRLAEVTRDRATFCPDFAA
jgi:O-succinylbenzoate synthase